MITFSEVVHAQAVSTVNGEHVDRMQAAEKIGTVTNQNLKKWMQKIIVVFKELQLFVHISSHDLQEPLRKIALLGTD